VDEAIEINQVEFETLESRLRNKNDTCRQIFCATNPSGKNHYLYNKFFNNPNADTFCANSFENKYLPEDYLNRLKTLPEFEFKRNVMGEWISPEGLCVPEFKRDCHVNTFKNDSYDSYVIGIDFGFTDPTCIVVAGLKDGKAFIIDELSMSNILNRDIINFLEKYRQVNPKIVVDPSAANFIAELQANNFNVEKATNSVQIGLMTLNDAFKSGYITIHNDCKNLINSLELYSYKLNSDIPDHKYSDICDATRYLMMYLKGNPFIKPTLCLAEEDLDDED
jgi:phage terminase large subunit